MVKVFFLLEMYYYGVVNNVLWKNGDIYPSPCFLLAEGYVARWNMKERFASLPWF